MRTGFQCDVNRCTACRIPRLRQCHCFRMGAPAWLRKPAPDNSAVLNNHASHSGIGPHAPKPTPPKGKRVHHEPFVGHQLFFFCCFWTQFRNEFVEIIRFLEVFVHRSKAHIGDRINAGHGRITSTCSRCHVSQVGFANRQRPCKFDSRRAAVAVPQ